MTSPCRTCDLCESDKNNPTCMNCEARIRYVARLGRDLCFARGRTSLDAPAGRFSILSRQAGFMAVSPEF